jgi:hypothetical protein
MKILYLSHGSGQDYLRDCLFHGLRSLLGSDVIDSSKLTSMYVGADRSQMYGRGMTLYAELPDIPVDRDDIPAKIASRYFDYIVYASIHRCQDYLHEAVSSYPADRLVAIDGEDHPGYLSGLGFLWYFKRELYNPQPNAYPISFAIPASKILSSPPAKSRLMAPCDPMNRSTYVYLDESVYYSQYASAYYAPTMKKAGWDCLRHYEILSQWTLPYFRVLDQLPSLICEKLPRRELMLAKLMLEYSKDNKEKDFTPQLQSLWSMLIEPVMSAFRRDLTTESLALRVLDRIGVHRVLTSIPAIPCMSEVLPA